MATGALAEGFGRGRGGGLADEMGKNYDHVFMLIK